MYRKVYKWKIKELTMGSDIHITSGEKMSYADRTQLKKECGVGTDEHKEEDPFDPPYSIGERHATPKLPEDCPETLLEAIEKGRDARFTMTISQDLFNRLQDDVPLSTGAPLINTIGELREQMANEKVDWRSYQERADEFLQN